MEFRRIEYFLILADKLNYTKAAAELFISPQALTKQIVILEEELGAQLFERTTRSVRLTEVGEVCRQEYGKIKEELDVSTEKIKNFIKNTKKVIRIGYFSALPKNEIVTPLVNSIKNLFTEMDIEIFTGTMDQIKFMLDEGKIDIGVTNAHDYEDWIGYDRINIKSMPAQIIVAPSHPWADKKEVTEEEMKEGSILLLERMRPLEHNSFYKNVEVKSKHYSKDFDSMITTLEMGRDFGVFPKVFNDMYKADFVYIDLPPKYKFYYRTMCVAKGDSGRKEIEMIMNLIRGTLDNYKL